MQKKILTLIIIFQLLLSCTREEKFVLIKKDFKDILQWQNDNHKQALTSFLNSCEKIDETSWDDIKEYIDTSENLNDLMYDKCGIAEIYQEKNLSAKQFFQEHFIPYLVTNK